MKLLHGWLVQAPFPLLNTMGRLSSQTNQGNQLHLENIYEPHLWMKTCLEGEFGP